MLKSIVTELFIRGRKINISLVFKRELPQIAINHSSHISTKDFNNIYKECAAEPHSFLVNDTTLASNNPLRFRKNLFNIECKFPQYSSII